MSRELRRCVITGDVFEDGRRHGDACPHHSYKKMRGLRDDQIVARIPRSADFPYGGYCCSDCHTIQELITVPGGTTYTGSPSRPRPEPPARSAGRGWRRVLAVVMAVLFGLGFAAAQQPWLVGAIVGACLGYWFKTVLKIVVALLVIAAIIGIASALLK